MKVLRVEQLFEASLSQAVLAKDNTLTGVLRGDDFIYMINNKIPLTLIPQLGGGQITVANVDEITSEITDGGVFDKDLSREYFNYNKHAIQDTNGKFYSISQIEKTSDFGGYGASAKRAKSVSSETIQCIVLAYKQYHRHNELEDSDYEKIFPHIEYYMNSVDPGKKDGKRLEVTKELMMEYESWISTFIRTANSLYESKHILLSHHNERILLEEIDYKFCHSRSENVVVNSIINAFKRAIKKMDLSWIVEISKWNPADIWAISKEHESEINKKLIECNSMTKLNNIIDDYFDKGQLVGISLKKIAENNKIKLVVNKTTRPPVYRFLKIDLQEIATSTACLKIVANRISKRGKALGKEAMTIRSFGTDDQNIRGEVVGSSATHGKVSLEKINEILQRNGVETVPTIDQVEKWWPENSVLSDQINRINAIILSSEYKSDIRAYTKKTPITRKRLVAKYQALRLAWIFITKEREIMDTVLEEMFHYAFSIKINQSEKGRTPKYARVID